MSDDSKEEAKLIEGGLAIDDRGQVVFVNDFHFGGVKRFYVVENFSKDVIRAFHGHQKEAKFVIAVSGSAMVVAVKMDNAENPSKENKTQKFVLSARKPAILSIPAGFANGFKPLEENTKLIFFSTASLEESKVDDFRFPYDYWGKEVWNVENR